MIEIKKLETLEETYTYLKLLFHAIPADEKFKQMIIEELLVLIENEEFPPAIAGDYMQVIINYIDSSDCRERIIEYLDNSIIELLIEFNNANVMQKD